jgi:hypothetical protein
MLDEIYSIFNTLTTCSSALKVKACQSKVRINSKSDHGKDITAKLEEGLFREFKSPLARGRVSVFIIRVSPMNRSDIGRPEVSLAGVNCKIWTVAEEVNLYEGDEGALSSS